MLEKQLVELALGIPAGRFEIPRQPVKNSQALPAVGGDPQELLTVGEGLEHVSFEGRLVRQGQASSWVEVVALSRFGRQIHTRSGASPRESHVHT